MLNDERSSEILQIQVEHGRPGGLSSYLGLFENDSSGIGCRVHSSNMPKEREVIGLHNRKKWKLLGDLANLVIPYKIKPTNIQNPL